MSEQTWACEAYGEDMPGPRHCFNEELGRCTSLEQCGARMVSTRQALFRRMQELAAHNPDDPTWTELADTFTDPTQLLGAPDDDNGLDPEVESP